MTRRKPFEHESLCRLQAAVVLLAVASVAAGCQGSHADATRTNTHPDKVSVSIRVPLDASAAPGKTPNPSGGTLKGRPSVGTGFFKSSDLSDNASVAPLSSTSSVGQFSTAPTFSTADVKRVRVDVRQTDNTPLYLNFDLGNGMGAWTGTLPDLPANQSLIFVATACDANQRTLFAGSTTQTLTGDNQTVSIALYPIEGPPGNFPQIVKVLIPPQLVSGQGANIGFVLQADVGAKLSYSISADPSGGTFYPVNGGITLAATGGTFVSEYIPPIVASQTSFTNSVTVIDTDNNLSTTYTFITTVLPPGTISMVQNTVINALFSPVIQGVNGNRLYQTSNVLWTATVSDDNPQSLSYAWSFTPNGTFNPAPDFVAGNANPATLENYTSQLQGTLSLAVTDTVTNLTTTISYPVLVNLFPDNPTQTNSLLAIGAGENHTCALTSNHTVRCWGSGQYGQLGYGNTSNVGDSPDGQPDEMPYSAGDVPIVGNVRQVAVGGNHTCALLETGLIQCWGLNDSGQLGYGITCPQLGDSSSNAISNLGYVNVGGVATKLAAGYAHTCALMSTGKVRCWGNNAYGQLGYGNTNNIGANELPFTAGDVDVGGPVQDIVAGHSHTCALLTNGNVRCWGYGYYGQLGYGSRANVGDQGTLPSGVGDVDVGGAVLQLTAGWWHTCALLTTGNVRCWGYSDYGQLGYGYWGAPNGYSDYNDVGISASTLPYEAGDVNVGDPVVQIAAGQRHTCALLTTGVVKCWGYNDSGQLGYGAMAGTPAPLNTAQPSDYVNLGGDTAYAITAGALHTCALLASGKAWCWGYNGYGQIGDGTTATRLSPVQSLLYNPGPPSGNVLAAGMEHSLAVRPDGTVWAWGDNYYGQLGDGTTTNRVSPVQVPGLTRVTALAAGAFHTLALRSDGTVWAWGLNDYGQLGDGTTTSRVSPVQVPGLTGVTALAAGGYHSLALRSDGTVWAWGDNYGDQGDGTTERLSPVQVSSLSDITAMVAGDYHSLALRSDGTVWAWGANWSGELGDGTTTDRLSPAQVPGLTGVTALAAGYIYSLALCSDGTVWAWGWNYKGRLGDGTTTTRLSPVQVSGLTNVTDLAAGEGQSLALRSDGTVWAWGANWTGGLGDGTTTDRLSPVQVSGLTGVTALVAGWYHSLALRSDGTVWAWGWNYGDLGDGTTTQRLSPVQSLLP